MPKFFKDPWVITGASIGLLALPSILAKLAPVISEVRLILGIA